MACEEGVSATTEIGEDLATAIDRGILPGRTTVVLVSGSGSTHVGVARGLARAPHARVVGLSTKLSAADQLIRLEKRHGDSVRLEVDDRFAVTGGGSTLESTASIKRWCSVMGGPELDYQYCGRLCQWLDSAVSSKSRIDDTNAVVLLITGIETRS